jgi:hypothetical protein
MIKGKDTVTSTITMHAGGNEEILRVSEEGVYYRGELAADAGECYAMLMDFLQKTKTNLVEGKE